MHTKRGRCRIVTLSVVIVFFCLCLNACGSGSSVSTSGGGAPQSPAKTETLLIADTGSNRVLIYDSPFSTGQSAKVALGQPDFTSAGSAMSASQMYQPVNAIPDSQGNIWVSEWGGSRVLQFKQPITSGMSASLVLGQADFTAHASSTSANGLSYPHGIAFDKSGNLWVADSYNARVLKFTPPFTNGMSASLVLGQPGLVTHLCFYTASGLCYPTDLAFDADGNLWVVDNGSNRVLKYAPPFVNGQSATTVLGQPDFTSWSSATGASGLNNPWGLAFDKTGNLWVTDGGNWRVLEFTPPFSNGQAAQLVLGYSDFTSTVNSDRQSNMQNPRGLAFDGNGNLFVADDGASRVMVFSPPFRNGMKASKVIGQPTFDSLGGTTTASGITNPVGVHITN